MAVFKKFSATLFPALLIAGAATSAHASGRMQTREAVPPPLGFISFCAQHLETCRVKYKEAATVVMSSGRWQELEQVQRTVNRAITATSDSKSSGTEERWSLVENGAGDCEDYALRKKQMLVEKGWSPASLLLTTAVTEKGEKHVVLTVATDQGDYVLDNRYDAPKAWDTLAYNWLARQDPLNPLIWRKAVGYGDERLASLN